MSKDPFARHDAAYLLGALDPAERAAYEAHLATCVECRTGLSEIAGIPPLLAGLDESVLAEPLPETLLPGLLRSARKERVRRRWLIAGLGALAAACAAAFIVAVLPAGTPAAPTPRTMTAVASSPVSATVALQPRPWGTQVDLTCWYQPGAVPPPGGYEYTLVAQDADGESYGLGSWRLVPGRQISFTGGTALSPDEIKDLRVVAPDGTAILALAP